MHKILKIASRNSQLALWQANYIKELIEKHNPEIKVEILEFVTQGDKNLQDSLANIGGKGLFIKELEVALLNGKADLAVHSMKDMPFQINNSFELITCGERYSPFDGFLSINYSSIDELPLHAIIGTSSPRRAAQILHYRKDLIIKPLRGNVNTRIKKLENNEYAAIILAKAGIDRLNLNQYFKSTIPLNIMLPAVGQGALGIEFTKENASYIKSILDQIIDFNQNLVIQAEREFNNCLSGSCNSAIGVFSEVNIKNGIRLLNLKGYAGSLDGKVSLREEYEDKIENALEIGQKLAQKLIDKGAKKLL
ncbi:MAG: hydroxymethylbilane synthase [Psittacicella sp.]